MIPGLFPPEVAVDWAPVVPDADAALLPAEEELAARMAPARRREFAAGRACARRALAALGAAPGPLLRGPRRSPRWPEGFVGSITHTRDWAAAAAARRVAFAGLGIDAEPFEPLSARALERICSAPERARLAALGSHPAERWGRVVFSAKESLYKAYFPATRHFLGFADAEIELDPAAGRFAARLTRADAPDAAGRRRFEGRFAIRESLVVTGLALPA